MLYTLELGKEVVFNPFSGSNTLYFVNVNRLDPEKYILALSTGDFSPNLNVYPTCKFFKRR